MTDSRPESTLAQRCARVIFQAFIDYDEAFLQISRRARGRFEQRQWKAAQEDTVERIELYDAWLARALDRLESLLGERLRDRELWAQIRAAHAEAIEPYLDSAFMKTFFSSVTRRVFRTMGVDPQVEYLALDIRPTESIHKRVPTYSFEHRGSTRYLLDELMGRYSFSVPYRNIDRSVAFIAREVDAFWQTAAPGETIHYIEVMQAVFYQSTRAYIVGRIEGNHSSIPVAIALQNTEAGILVDTVLLSASEVSMLFSFTRSYFHIDLETVGDAIVFLKGLLPKKPISELYTVLGRAKQGKTERYRSFMHHLDNSDDLFIDAPGEKGMVMIVFTLPSYDIVFKIIRDRFPYPKTTSRAEVIGKYQLVFKHDRAGRLVDAQEFRRLEFPKDRFSPELLEELLGQAAQTCSIEGDYVLIDHCYVERRMTPLNLYLRDAPRKEIHRAVIDYGQSIRDLAATNIFPGDLLAKNFGVTRHGRVIFYDYDELCLITECRFRDLPRASSYEDEMRAEAWFYVGEDDVFPEQFLNFLGLDGQGKEIFARYHGELLTAEYWRGIQSTIRQGDVIEIVPYTRVHQPVSRANP